MIIVDDALRARAASDDPVRVAMVGAGFQGRGIANQIINSTPGMRLVAIANRTPATAVRAYQEAGVTDVESVSSASALEDAIRAGRAAVTDDPLILAEAASVEAIIEVTGTVEYAARFVLHAIEHRKHVVLMNAELDGTVGPLLKLRADQAGVILSGCDGDQPGVQLNLYRFVTGLGLRPLLCGNIKGLEDHYRNPTTQQGWAERWGMSAPMVTSFADGTKISFEQAIVANATGFRVARRGMYGHHVQGHVDDLTGLWDVAEMERLGGIVDYVVGAQPAPGVFVYATHDDPRQRHYLALYKRGDGPLYSFYTPYHLCHFEVPTSVARVVLCHDTVLAPRGEPVVDVVTTAKVDLAAGDVIDGLGGYLTYGQCENSDIAIRDGLLPIGLAEGCRVLRPVPRDGVLTYADVELPPGRLIDQLRAEQTATFFGPAPLAAS
ncbi:MAG TPA: SAF domain-containing protein [Candidatus Limnocylindrales bacterium]